MTDQKWLKGSAFQNRYRIEGTITTTSPLHISSGQEGEYEGEHTCSEVVYDHRCLPYIPGSTLRGNLRSWLVSVLKSINASCVDDHETVLQANDQRKNIQFLETQSSTMARLFGTSANESKLEVWDAFCITEIEAEENEKYQDLMYWEQEKLTYIQHSVAIDPTTGTAIDKKLYSFELVPPGIKFQVNILGQNISAIEMGMLLFALEGFNSKIFAVTLGGMNNRGFGHFSWKLDNLYYLGQDNVKDWVKKECMNAGYENLEKQSVQDTENFISTFKEQFLTLVGD